MALVTASLLSMGQSCFAQVAFPQESTADLESLEAQATSGQFPVPNKKFCNLWPNCVPVHCLPKCFCLQSTFGTYRQGNPSKLRDSGAFKLDGLVRGKGVFTWKEECYSSQMRYSGEDEHYYYYRALRTPYCFAITKKQFSKRYRIMFICNRCDSGNFQFYQLATNFNCKHDQTCHTHHSPSCHVGHSCVIRHSCRKYYCCPY